MKNAGVPNFANVAVGCFVQQVGFLSTTAKLVKNVNHLLSLPQSLSRNHAYPTKKMSTSVVVHMSANRNTYQCRVYVGPVCLCVAQQLTFKAVRTARTLSVCSFLQTWLEKIWQSSSLVTTVPCAKLVFLLTAVPSDAKHDGRKNLALHIPQRTQGFARRTSRFGQERMTQNVF